MQSVRCLKIRLQGGQRAVLYLQLNRIYWPQTKTKESIYYKYIGQECCEKKINPITSTAIRAHTPRPEKKTKNRPSSYIDYFKRDDSSSEVELLIEKECSVVPVEVKAKKGGTSSLDSLLKKDEIKYGYKIVNGNVGQLGKKITIPHYMCMFL